TARDARLWVNHPADQWTPLVQSAGSGVPPGAPGTTDAEKTASYVGQILTQVEAVFPTPFLGTRLPASPVATFFKSSTYDILRSYPARFFAQNPNAAAGLSDADRAQVIALTLAYRLTGNAGEATALAGKGVASALKIARMDRGVFVARMAGALTSERAGQVYDQAVATNATVLALLG